MTIEEIRTEKVKAEMAIYEILAKLQNETTMLVENVSVKNIETTNKVDGPSYLIGHVRIELVL